ncbi:AAA family ATPase [Mesorhizobium sp. M0520]|uniref:AAA family ATPase n=1 Tax=Mesorhizobium sp. M0520 TaxID=2956957 RepID=UPI00333B1596
MNPYERMRDLLRSGEVSFVRLLELLDGSSKTFGVIVVGATNNPGMIDPALLRSGRSTSFSQNRTRRRWQESCAII